MAKLLATTTAQKDCAQLEEINAALLRPLLLPARKGPAPEHAGFELVGAAEYGTGGVVDYRSGKLKDGAAVVLLSRPTATGASAASASSPTPSTKTSDDDSRDGYRAGCRRLSRRHPRARLQGLPKVAFISPEVKDKEICSKVFAATKELAKRMKAAARRRAGLSGWQRHLWLLQLRDDEPDRQLDDQRRQVRLGRRGSYVVLDVAPSPTAAEQRRVEREYRRQLKNRGMQQGTSKQPSPVRTTTDPSCACSPRRRPSAMRDARWRRRSGSRRSARRDGRLSRSPA